MIAAPETHEFWTGLTARTKYQREQQVQPWKGLSDCPGICLALGLLAATVVDEKNTPRNPDRACSQEGEAVSKGDRKLGSPSRRCALQDPSEDSPLTPNTPSRKTGSSSCYSGCQAQVPAGPSKSFPVD